jgi:hypothetical protein
MLETIATALGRIKSFFTSDSGGLDPLDPEEVEQVSDLLGDPENMTAIAEQADELVEIDPEDFDGITIEDIQNGDVTFDVVVKNRND